MTQDGIKSYRFRRYFLNVGIAETIFALLMGVTSFVMAFENVDGSFARPRLAAAGFLVFWGCFALLGVYLILVYLRAKLCISEEHIQQTGCMLTKRIRLDDVTSVKWRAFPQGGSLVLRTRNCRLVVEFGVFTPSEGKEVIWFLHNRLAEQIQQDWQDFESRVLSEPVKDPESTGRYFVLLSFLFVSFACIFGLTWAFGFGEYYLFLAILNAVAGAWSLYKRAIERSKAQV